MAVVLDTTFLVDLGRSDEAAHALLDRLGEEGEPLLVPAIVLAEYLAGNPRTHDVALVRQATEVLPFSESDAEVAGRIAAASIRRGVFPGWSDIMIAGFAENRGGLRIVTRNSRHFPAAKVLTY